MAAALDVIGVVSSGIGILQFAQSFFPASDPPTSHAGDSKLRIAVGKNANMGGSIAAINLYDVDQTQVSHNEYNGLELNLYSSIAQGSFTDFDKLDTNGQQPYYLQIVNGEDASCIAYMTQTWPDGQQRGWVGDMGKLCGQSWGWSNITLSAGDDAPALACTWLDWNHDNIRSAGMQIRMQDFAAPKDGESYSKKPEHYCSAPVQIFNINIDGGTDTQFWTQSADAQPAAVGTGRRRKEKRGDGARKKVKRSQALASQITGSHHPGHSAVELCESKTSYGEDFVNFREGVYCDMESKKLWPLCEEKVKEECYDWNEHAILRRDGKEQKIYEKVEIWGQEL